MKQTPSLGCYRLVGNNRIITIAATTPPSLSLAQMGHAVSRSCWYVCIGSDSRLRLSDNVSRLEAPLDHAATFQMSPGLESAIF